MNCRKQYAWCSIDGELAEVAVYCLVFVAVAVEINNYGR